VVPVTQLPSAWSAEPVVLATAAVAALLFARAFVRLRRRGRTDHAGWGRALLFAAGLGLLTLPLVSPLDAVADGYLLSAHMLEHVLIGDAAPALLLLAVRGPLLAFMLPPSAVRFVNRHGASRALFERLGRPGVALAVWAATMGIWHVPALYDAALAHERLHELEHACFFFAGLLVWTQLIDPARRGRLSVKGRAAFAGLLFLIGQVLSGVLFLSPPLYSWYSAQPVRLWGLTPLADQQYAGLVMMGEQLLTLGTCVLLLGWSMLPPPIEARSRRTESPVW
jgi:putative membrane protein